MNCHLESLVWLPIVLLVIMLNGILICYGIAVKLGHVPHLPNLAYISDVGAEPPESCIFTMVFVLGGIISFASMFFYYKYILQNGIKSRCNFSGLIIGGFSSFGMIMVGAFQERNIHAVHITGAIFAFVGGAVYGIMAAYMTWQYKSLYGDGTRIAITRIVFAVVQSLAGILLIVALILRSINKPKYDDFAIVSEWILGYTSFGFLGTLVYELTNVRSASVTLSLYPNEKKLCAEEV